MFSTPLNSLIAFWHNFPIFTSSGLYDTNSRAKLQFLESFHPVSIAGTSLQEMFAIISLGFHSGKIMFSVLLYCVNGDSWQQSKENPLTSLYEEMSTSELVTENESRFSDHFQSDFGSLAVCITIQKLTGRRF